MISEGKWEYEEELRATLSMIGGTQAVVCGLPNPIESCNFDTELEEMRANATLIVTAVNACKEINPENPQAVADKIVQAFEALNLLTCAYGATDGRNGNSGECWDKARAALSSVGGNMVRTTAEEVDLNDI